MYIAKRYVLFVNYSYSSTDLSVLPVGNADDGGVDDVVGAEQPRLEDVGCDLVHPEVNEVLNLLDEVDHALVVVVAKVAGVEEAVVVQELKKKYVC